jgi:hypothetical protein
MLMLPNPFKSMFDPQTLYLQRLRDGIPVELAKAALNARTDEEPSCSEAFMTDFGAYSPPKVPNPTTPVQTITRFNLTINAKTAKALEITIPPTMLMHRVIE